MTQKQTTAVQTTPDKGVVSYIANGNEVKLSYAIVRNYLTKGNGKVTDQDLVQFIQVCRFNQLNPFLNEAYLIKYGDQPAQMVVSKEALMKRAETNEKYDGIKAGIIIKTADGNLVNREGCFYENGDELLGGWAEVYRKDRKYPYVANVRLSEYSTGKSMWLAKPSTMIRKVAVVQALREAFPVQLGAMYTSEEQSVQTEEVPYEVVQTMQEQKQPFASEEIANVGNVQAREENTAVMGENPPRIEDLQADNECGF